MKPKNRQEFIAKFESVKESWHLAPDWVRQWTMELLMEDARRIGLWGISGAEEELAMRDLEKELRTELDEAGEQEKFSEECTKYEEMGGEYDVN